MGVFALYTFVAPFLTRAIGFQPASVPIILFVFGLAGWLGNMTGGRLTDRLGAARTLGAALLMLGTNYLGFGFWGLIGPSSAAMAGMICGFVIGGIAGWAFHPAQSARLVQYAPDAAVVALSLNQSALYFGTAAGAALGALIVASGPVTNLAWTAAACQFAALAMLALSLRRARSVALQAAE
jgi:predicted MFS family arabinose efflux permease